MGYTSVLVVIERLSKQGIFIATHDTITSSDLALLFIIHVFSKRGIPAHVTCNRGSKVISHFFQSLGMALDMYLHFTLGYHPKGDGQTECPNQTLEQYIQVYCNNWFGLLPLVEFTYNNALSATMTITPIYTNKGYHLNLTIHPEWELASSWAKEFVTSLNKNTWQQHNSSIKVLWMLLKPQLQNSQLGVGPTSRHSFSVLPIHLRSSLISFWDHTR